MLACPQDCNLVLYSATYLQTGPGGSAAFWGSSTYGQGTGLCTLSVQGASAGPAGLVIKDSAQKTVWTTAGKALPAINAIPAGHALAQGGKLYSPNGQYFLVLQQDGNLVICERPPLHRLLGRTRRCLLPATCC